MATKRESERFLGVLVPQGPSACGMNECVLDTSALVAGLLAKRGAAPRLVDAIFAGGLRPVYTAPIVAEYAEVLARPSWQSPQPSAGRSC